MHGDRSRPVCHRNWHSALRSSPHTCCELRYKDTMSTCMLAHRQRCAMAVALAKDHCCPENNIPAINKRATLLYVTAYATVLPIDPMGANLEAMHQQRLRTHSSKMIVPESSPAWTAICPAEGHLEPGVS